MALHESTKENVRKHLEDVSLHVSASSCVPRSLRALNRPRRIAFSVSVLPDRTFY